MNWPKTKNRHSLLLKESRERNFTSKLNLLCAMFIEKSNNDTESDVYLSNMEAVVDESITKCKVIK